jgi:hypothetical protein
MAGIAAAPAQAGPDTKAHYACRYDQQFTVSRSGVNATVEFADRRYELRRRPGSFGARYGSADAALIIDGDSAVFVASDRLDLEDCFRVDGPRAGGRERPIMAPDRSGRG